MVQRMLKIGIFKDFMALKSAETSASTVNKKFSITANRSLDSLEVSEVGTSKLFLGHLLTS
jgi:hypothetical protein